MATARDVAQYILSARGPMTSMKMQKLVYYAQAWSVVWDDDVIFSEPTEAWKNGPVVRDLWEANRNQFRITTVEGGNPDRLDANQRETVDRVLEYYGDHDAQWLSDLTHMEDPWKDAYKIHENAEITPTAMSVYYSSLTSDALNSDDVEAA